MKKEDIYVVIALFGFLLIRHLLKILPYKTKDALTNLIVNRGFGFIVTQIIIISMLFIPWAIVSGEIYTGFELAYNFSYMPIYFIFFLALATILLIIAGSPQSIWLAVLLNIVNCIFFIYRIVVCHDPSLEFINKVPTILVVFFILAATLGGGLAGNTKLDQNTPFGNFIHTWFGQGNYSNRYKEVAETLNANFKEPGNLYESPSINGQIKDYNFSVYHISKVFASSTEKCKVLRVELDVSKSYPKFLIVLAKGYRNDFVIYEEMMEKENPVNILKRIPELKFSDLQIDRRVHIESREMAERYNIYNILNLINENISCIKDGWIVSFDGKLYFETVLWTVKRKDTLINILNLLTKIADSLQNC